MQVNVHKTAKQSDKSLRTLDDHIWNPLPEHIKAESNFIKFKEAYVSIVTNKYMNHMITTSDLIRSMKMVLIFVLAFQFNMEIYFLDLIVVI